MTGSQAAAPDGQGQQSQPISIPISDKPDAKKKVEEKELLKCFGDKWIGRKWNRIKLLFTKGIWVNNKEAKKLLGKLTFSQLEKISNSFEGARSSSNVADFPDQAASQVATPAGEHIKVMSKFQEIVGEAKKSEGTKVDLAVGDFETKNRKTIASNQMFLRFLLDKHPESYSNLEDAVLFSQWVSDEDLSVTLNEFKQYLVNLIKEGKLTVEDLDNADKLDEVSGITIEQLSEAAKQVYSFEQTFAANTDLAPQGKISEPEIFGDTNCSAGRLESTSETDQHQLKGARNDDNVVIARYKLLDGKEATVTIELDGAGSGGELSAEFSNAMAIALQEKIEDKLSLLKLYAEAGDEQKMQDLVHQAAVSAFEQVQKQKSDILEWGNGASTLSAAVTIPIEDGSTLVCGLQAHDSTSVLWNPTSGQFEVDTMQEGGKQIGGGEPIDDISGSIHSFSYRSEGRKFVTAFSDGVLDTLPPQIFEGKDNPDSDDIISEKTKKRIQILADIIANPAFDVIPDQKLEGLTLTEEQIQGVGTETRTSSGDITPEMMRNRVLNYAMWATTSTREGQARVDNFNNNVMMKGKSIPLQYSFNMEDPISNAEYELFDDRTKACYEQKEGVWKPTREPGNQRFSWDVFIEEDLTKYEVTQDLPKRELGVIDTPENIQDKIDQEQNSAEKLRLRRLKEYCNSLGDPRVQENTGKNCFLVAQSETTKITKGSELSRDDIPEGAVQPKTDGVSIAINVFGE